MAPAAAIAVDEEPVELGEMPAPVPQSDLDRLFARHQQRATISAAVGFDRWRRRIARLNDTMETSHVETRGFTYGGIPHPIIGKE